MIIDLLHNKIVKETITEDFARSVKENLIPKLTELYGASFSGIQMYEDYLNEQLVKDGFWYYPMTVLIGEVNAVVWIKWDISDKQKFASDVPYSYVGSENIDFVIADDVPVAFKNALLGKSNYFEGGYVKLNVTTDAPSPTILSGKYSQTFVDEMNRQISEAICKACGVKGLENSSIELDLVFAPNTYMEHTSENVTYRRLLISAKGCGARDFWIKWTRVASSSAFSVNDNVNSLNVIFELGEDVPHKTREKEYRFLVYGNSDKYRVAMGRKNITEWRELIKRAVKRGELVKTTTELEDDVRVSEVSDKLSQILEKCGVAVPAAVSEEIRSGADEANEALRLAVLGSMDSESIDSEELVDSEAVNDTMEDENEQLAFEYEESSDDSSEDELATEISAEDSSSEFDFSVSNEEFLLGAEGVELTMEDILEEFIPKAEPNEDAGGKLEFFEQLNIDGISESDSIRLDKDKTAFDEEEIEEEIEAAAEECEENEEETAEPEAEEETETDEETETEDEPEVNLIEAENPGKVEIKVERTYYGDDVIERLQTEIANARRLLESEKMAREQAELALERERMENSSMKAQLSEALAGSEEACGKISEAYVLQQTAENMLELERASSQELRSQLEKQKFAIEQIKALLEEETNARELAEAEAARLRAEFEPLKNENIRLVEATREAEEACFAAENKCREYEEKLIQQIELYEKEKEREKNLFAEAARQAQENERNLAEQRKVEAERYAESDATISEAAAEEPIAPEKSIEERAREARMRMEELSRRMTEEKVGEVSDSAVSREAKEAEQNLCELNENSEENSDSEEVTEAEETAPAAEEVASLDEPLINYTYTSKLVRLLFARTIDPNITARLREMISFALTEFKKDKLYIKVKASTPDNTTVVLNFVKFPEEEKQLLVDIINYLCNSDLGIYRALLEE